MSAKWKDKHGPTQRGSTFARLWTNGVPSSVLAERFGITKQQVSDVRRILDLPIRAREPFPAPGGPKVRQAERAEPITLAYIDFMGTDCVRPEYRYQRFIPSRRPESGGCPQTAAQSLLS